MKNVVCVKWGNKFSSDYVNRLFYMVSKNLSIPFRFVCFTDNTTGIDKQIETKNILFNDLEYSWNKISIFSKSLYDLEGTCLFLDLDILIINNIDCLFEYNKDYSFIGVKEWIQKPEFKFIYNSSVFRFELGKHCNVIDNFYSYQKDNRLVKIKMWDEYLKSNSKTLFKDVTVDKIYREQQWTSEQIGLINTFPENWCISYKLSKHDLENCKILIFHGYPKPSDIPKNKLVTTYWLKEMESPLNS